MSDWIHTRPPTYDELPDHKLTFATARTFVLNEPVGLGVKLTSGFSIRTYWESDSINESIAWMPHPQPYDGGKK